MRRVLFNAAALLSALLLVAVLGLWIESYSFRHELGSHCRSCWIGVASAEGGLLLGVRPGRLPRTWAFVSGNDDTHLPVPMMYHSVTIYGRTFDWRRAGFAYAWNQQFGPSLRLHLVLLPYWSIALILAVLPTTWLIKRLRKRPGCCRHCGYDLRGNRESSTCPECGQAMPTSSPS